MQIKAADDRSGDVLALEGLLARSDVSPVMRANIERELRALRAGIAGEREAAYEIELYFNRTRNFMTIHDLRFEVDGYAAQIDHLILTRLGEIWVCESKHFAEGVAVNEHGEWSMFWHGRPQGIASPIDQNRRHVLLIERLFDDRRVPLPKRLGLVAMRPIVRSLVLVSNNARIGRPRRSVGGLDEVIKVEKLEQTVRALDNVPATALTRTMGTEGLEAFARSFAAVHTPRPFDWAAKFGLSRAGAAAPSVHHLDTEAVSLDEPAKPRRSGHRCASCGEPVSFAVVRFCWNNSARFGGKVYCMSCQAAIPRS